MSPGLVESWRIEGRKKGSLPRRGGSGREERTKKDSRATGDEENLAVRGSRYSEGHKAKKPSCDVATLRGWGRNFVAKSVRR